MQCLILLTVLAFAQAGVLPVVQHVDAPAVAVVSAPATPAVVETGVSTQYRSQDSVGNYAFSYDEDHTSGGTFRRESGDAEGNVAGSYGLKDADGRQRIVNYIADKDGFRANIQTNEPGVEPKDPADVKINKAEVVEVVEEPVKSVHLLSAAKETAVIAPASHADVVVAEHPATTVKVEAPGAVTYTTVEKEPVAHVSTIPEIHHAAPVGVHVAVPNIHYSAVPAIPKVHHSAIAVPSIYGASHGLHYAAAPLHYISPLNAAYAVATTANLSATAHKVTTTSSDVHHEVPALKYAVKPALLTGSPFAYYAHVAY